MITNMKIIINNIRPTLLVLAAITAAPAAERHFAYAQESAGLAPGSAEVELQATRKEGRKDHWVRQESRLEVEFGLAEGLMGALYLNHQQVTKAVDGTTDDLTSSTVQGISGELKYQFSDPVADPLGSAAYVEVTGETDAVEYEFKAILDKQVGPVLFAANAIYEIELAQETAAEKVREVKYGGILSAVHTVGPRTRVGLETDWRNVRTDEGIDSAIFGGPVIHYQGGKYWLTAAVLPQLAGLRHHDDAESGRNLSEFHRWEARVLLGVDF